MGKLLSKQLNNQKNDAGNLTGYHKKIIALAVQATQLFFCQRTAKTFSINLIQDVLS